MPRSPSGAAESLAPALAPVAAQVRALQELLGTMGYHSGDEDMHFWCGKWQLSSWETAAAVPAVASGE